MVAENGLPWWNKAADGLFGFLFCEVGLCHDVFVIAFNVDAKQTDDGYDTVMQFHITVMYSASSFQKTFAYKYERVISSVMI